MPFRSRMLPYRSHHGYVYKSRPAISFSRKSNKKDRWSALSVPRGRMSNIWTINCWVDIAYPQAFTPDNTVRFVFGLSDLPASQYQALYTIFDEYFIEKITFRCFLNGFQSGSSTSTAFNETADITMAPLYAEPVNQNVNDYTAILANIPSQRNKIINPSSGNNMFDMTIYPKVSIADQDGTNRSPQRTWLRFNGAQGNETTHRGLVMDHRVRPTGSSYPGSPIQFKAHYTISFRCN